MGIIHAEVVINGDLKMSLDTTDEELERFLSCQEVQHLARFAESLGIQLNLDSLKNSNDAAASEIITSCRKRKILVDLAIRVEQEWPYNWANARSPIRGTSTN